MKKKTLFLAGVGYALGAALLYSYKSEGTPELPQPTPPPPPPPPPEPPGVLPGEKVSDSRSTEPEVTPVPTPPPAPAPPTLEDMKAQADLERLAATTPEAHAALLGALSRNDVATLLQYGAQLTSEYPSLAAHVGEIATAISTGQEPSRIVLNPQPIAPSAVSGTPVVGGKQPRWTFWYTKRHGQSGWTTTNPEVLTAYDAWTLQHRTRMRYPGVLMYRFVYEPSIAPTWIYDTRSDMELHAEAPLKRPGAYA